MKTKKTSSIIKLYTDQINYIHLWIQKKEVSIWGATLLHIAIMGYSSSFIIQQKIQLDLIQKCCIIIISFILTLLFLIFIYSQFSTWIASVALINTLKYGIHKLTFNPAQYNNSDLELNEFPPSVPAFLVLVYNKQIESESVNKFHNRKRPIKVFLYISLGFITLFLGKKWREKLNLNREKQEGIIYFLMLLVWIIFVLNLFFIKIPANNAL